MMKIVRPVPALVMAPAVLVVILVLLQAQAGQAAPPAEAAVVESDTEMSPVRQARQVMDEFMNTFNARDVAALADTLLFPHVRVASGGVVVIPSKSAFIERTDMQQFALQNNWQHSAWEHIEAIQAGPDKVHFKVVFSRYNPAGEKYASFDSLYIVQRVAGRWGIRARSSFAP